MKVMYINTRNISIVKDMLIRGAIQAGMKYIEMENEVIIDGNYLFRIIEKVDVNIIDLNDILNKEFSSDQFIDIIDDEFVSINYQSNIHKLKKSDYKRESKKVNNIVKTKQYHNRRKYQ